MQDIMFVGLDVHKATISVAVVQGARRGEVRSWGTIPNRADHGRRLAKKLGSDGRRVHLCYEAGPRGYCLHRQLTELGNELHGPGALTYPGEGGVPGLDRLARCGDSGETAPGG